MLNTCNVTQSQPREDETMSTQKPPADAASRRDFLIGGAAVVAAAALPAPTVAAPAMTTAPTP